MYFLHIALRDFEKEYFVSTFWPQHSGAELGVSADIFGNYDVPHHEDSRVTRSKQCNVWRRTKMRTLSFVLSPCCPLHNNPNEITRLYYIMGLQEMVVTALRAIYNQQ